MRKFKILKKRKRERGVEGGWRVGDWLP